MAEWNQEEAKVGEAETCREKATDHDDRNRGVRTSFSRKGTNICKKDLGAGISQIMEKVGSVSERSLKSRNSEKFLTDSISRVTVLKSGYFLLIQSLG